MKINKLGFFTKFGIFIIFSFFSVLYVFGYRFSLSNYDIYKTGILSISTYPYTVQLSLNNDTIYLNKNNTSFINNLEIGKYNLKIDKKNYVDYNCMINIDDLYIQEIKDLILFPNDFNIILEKIINFKDIYVLQNNIIINYANSNYYYDFEKLKKLDKFVDIENIIDLQNNKFLIYNNKKYYLFNKEKFLKEIDFEHIDIKKAIMHNDNIIYLYDNKIFKFDTQYYSKVLLLNNIKQFKYIKNNLIYIETNKNDFIYNINTFEIEQILDQKIEKIIKFNNDYLILYENKDLYYKDKLIQTKVDNLSLGLDNTIYIQRHQDIYIYNIETRESKFIFRSFENINLFFNGQVYNLLYIKTDNAIYLIDWLNNNIYDYKINPDSKFYILNNYKIFLDNNILYKINF